MLTAFPPLEPPRDSPCKEPVVLSLSPLLGMAWTPKLLLIYGFTSFSVCINGPIFNTFCDAGLFILCICGNK